MILLVLNDERRCTVEQIVELTNLGENKIVNVKSCALAN